MSLELISLETIQQIAHEYGYWSVFLGILVENMGVPIPGETITIVGGFLAGSGELNYWYVLGSAIAGAVIGNNFGYWIGFYGGWPLLTRLGKVFRISEKRLISVRDQFSQNAAKAVFIGRFVALLRVFAGPLAGIVQMPYPQFIVWNLAGAAAWASVMVSLSFFLGKLIPLEQLITWVAQLGGLVLLVVVVWVAVAAWLESRSKEIELPEVPEANEAPSVSQ
jgi:membrane protein DedA with SNARE-associated domain